MTLLLFHGTLLTTLLTLATPIIIPNFATPKAITKTMKLATLLSLAPALIFTNLGLESITTQLYWTSQNLNLQISFLFDTYATLFLPIALFITWAILEFTNWYMATDPHLNKFSKYLLLFLIAMTILTTANNMLQLFIGWEGVGIMSFLLIGWWHARTNANTSALQAIIYNRLGDIGLVLALAWFATNYNTWEMQLMFSHPNTNLLPLLGLVLAATGKSAQFGLHPWLPAAMEGPTPVSALLHSSTMVVAGIFLLIRLHPLMAPSAQIMTLCLCLGALTTTFAALCALTQNDIKKIIAFSTSSQLGLMMVTIGMNQPKLAFLHITTHAFFKAMLFLCSGSIIHSLNDEQDIRKMGGLQKTLPITTSCLTLGSLALAGMPFLSGFYTKDTIIETLSTSPLNAWALTITLVATALTAAYSTRLIFFTHLNTPRHTTMINPSEQDTGQTRPLLRLAMGSTLFGLIITTTTTPYTPQNMTMPTAIKLLAAVATLTGLICSLDLAQQALAFTAHTTNPNQTSWTHMGFFNTITHRYLPMKKMKTAQTVSLQSNDLLWYEAVAPMMLKTTNSLIASKMSTHHTSNIKTHLMMLTALLTSALAWTSL